LDLFADLGVKALRYPLLWERIAPDHPDNFDWRWSDQRIRRLRELQIRPIAGLLHHGSGPGYTNLLDEAFPAKFASYARAVAERYPDIVDWTPVNEPLTTARFSCLYGHWYPHKSNESDFWTALFNQVEATALAMSEIRKVNPAARLIQTEDLGRTYATPATAEQAEYDNARRWMSFDLLCGRVDPAHPLWSRLAAFGFEARLGRMLEGHCRPDVFGINHYVTSDRFLDGDCGAYPPERCGGNGTIAYADVEAVRVLSPGPAGVEGALCETWERYGGTLAITERHLGCTREEQVRWLDEAWDVAGELRRAGVPVEAVTAWSLLGAYDWNSLLTRQSGHYESGAFDVRGGQPRPTALAQAMRRLAGSGDERPHPAVEGPGWWRRDVRLELRPAFRAVGAGEPRRWWRFRPTGARPILITGATGTLGKALARACEWRGLSYVLTDRRTLDICRADEIGRRLDDLRPWAVINAAGYVRVDEAEREPNACRQANTVGAIELAKACAERDIYFLGVSSDLVFDGDLRRAYTESDVPRPLNVYGESKAEAERQILALGGRALVARTAAFFSADDPYNFAAHVLRGLAADQEVRTVSDLVVSPTYVPDLVNAMLDLAIDGETGLWHLANEGAVTWTQFGVMIAQAFGYPITRLRGLPCRALGLSAHQPAYSALSSERGQLLPPLSEAIDRLVIATRRPQQPSQSNMHAGREAADLPQKRSDRAAG
jgi:dTDP-4-dehydrorhamnose reductase